MIPDDMPLTISELVQCLPNFVRKLEDFAMDKVIGKGGFGEVWHAIDKRTKAECAVKKLFADKLGPKIKKTFIRECFANVCCADKYVVKLIGFTVEPPYCIITAYQNHGSLMDYIYPEMRRFNILKPTHLTIIAMDLAHGLHRIQKNNFIHRDLKPGNILLNEKFQPQIADFGVARIVDFDNFMTKRCGTIIYMSPELFNQRNYDSYSDVYAFGILLYEMAEKTHAYNGVNKAQMEAILRDGTQRPPFKKTKGPLKQLIEQCWAKNPDDRPSFGKIYKLFASGKVAFEGTKREKVKKNYRHTKEYDKLEHHDPKCYVNIDKILDKLEKEEAAEAEAAEEPMNQEEEENEEMSQNKFIPEKAPSDDDDKNAPPSDLITNEMGMGELDLSMFASKGAAATTNNFASRRGPVIISQKAASGVAMRAEASNGQNNYNSALGPPPQMSRYGSPSPPPSNLITSPLRIPGNFAGTPPPQQQMQMQNANALPPNPAVLGNQSDPGFLMHLHEVSRSLNEAFIEPFFAPTIQYIITITNEKTACEVLTAYAEGVRACPRFAEVLYQRNIFTRLPVGSDAQIDASLDLLGSLFSSAPYVITDALAQWIKFFFVKKPEELVTMYSHYVKKVTDYKQHLGVLDVLIQGGGLFAQLECADKYINVLTYLCKNQEYWSMRIEKIKPIVLYFINSSNPKIAAAAYSSLASIYDGNLTLDYNAVADHAQNVEVAKAITSLLIRMRNELGASQELACLLLQLSRISEEALTLLLYKIQTSAELAAFVAADSSWYSVPLPTILGTLKIVLVLIIVPQSRSIILNSPDFNTILNFFASVPDNYSMGSLSILLQKLSLSQQTVAALSQCGFFKNIARNIAYITDANSIASLCILISTVAKVSQCVDFPLLIKPLMTVGKNLPEASGAVAQTLAGLSIHPNVNSAMKQMKLKSMFTLLFQVSGFQNIVGPALKNF